MLAMRFHVLVGCGLRVIHTWCSGLFLWQVFGFHSSTKHSFPVIGSLRFVFFNEGLEFPLALAQTARLLRGGELWNLNPKAPIIRRGALCPLSRTRISVGVDLLLTVINVDITLTLLTCVWFGTTALSSCLSRKIRNVSDIWYNILNFPLAEICFGL